MTTVYLSPTGLCAGARAMQRISRALARYTPPTIEIVTDPAAADLHVLYVISADAIPYARQLKQQGKKYAAIQCCYKTAGGDRTDWLWLWRYSEMVWSYLDLHEEMAVFHPYPVDYYYAPLGLDDAFLQPFDLSSPREPLVVTTGYVHGHCGEAILEVWQASLLVGLRCIHIGPKQVEGIPAELVPSNVTTMESVTDEELASLYRRAWWVSSMRHGEGFELPAAEGLSCGARAILFNHSNLKHWYGEAAMYMEECEGDKLTSSLVEMFQMMGEPPPVEKKEIKQLRETFNWETICTGFWDRLLNA